MQHGYFPPLAMYGAYGPYYALPAPGAYVRAAPVQHAAVPYAYAMPYQPATSAAVSVAQESTAAAGSAGAAGRSHGSDFVDMQNATAAERVLAAIPAVMLDRVPDGVEVKKNAYGYGLYATKAFRAGETLYTGKWVDVPDRRGQTALVTQHAEYTLDIDVHSVIYDEERGRRMYYGFDSFMNHSCSPTTFSALDPGYWERHDYRTVACRDLAPGDEITCDYLLFDWDCGDKAIPRCFCGTPECVGAVSGFKFLAREQMAPRIGRIDDYVFELLRAEKGAGLLYLGDVAPAPGTVRIESTPDPANGRARRSVFAARAFSAGEVIARSAVVLVARGTLVVASLQGERTMPPATPLAGADVDAVVINDVAGYIGARPAGAQANCTVRHVGSQGVTELVAVTAIAEGTALVL